MILTLGALALVVVPLVVLSVMLVKEAGSAERAVREWIASGGVQQLPDRLGTSRRKGGARVVGTIHGTGKRPGAICVIQRQNVQQVHRG